MSVVLDIFRTYRAPREVQARRMDGPKHEARGLAVLLGACALIYVAQWPRFAREAFLDPSMSVEARMAGGLFAWMMVMPLIFYGVSLVLVLVMRAAGRPVGGYACRMALFWGLLASAPLWLLSGLMAGFAPGVGFVIVSSAALLAVVVFAAAGLMTARSGNMRQA